MPSAPPAPLDDDVALMDIEDTLPPEVQRAVCDYVLAHVEPTQARIEALFTPDLRVYGNQLPPQGLDREGYLDFLQKLYGTVFRQAANTRLFLTHDGRVVFRWTLNAGPRRIAAGLDYLTIKGGRISKIVGLY
jgi:hypothetical protein